jgi:hypothetical protein
MEKVGALVRIRDSKRSIRVRVRSELTHLKWLVGLTLHRERSHQELVRVAIGDQVVSLHKLPQMYNLAGCSAF